jgi:hypothetical protein
LAAKVFRPALLKALEGQTPLLPVLFPLVPGLPALPHRALPVTWVVSVRVVTVAGEAKPRKAQVRLLPVLSLLAPFPPQPLLLALFEALAVSDRTLRTLATPSSSPLRPLLLALPSPDWQAVVRVAVTVVVTAAITARALARLHPVLFLLVPLPPAMQEVSGALVRVSRAPGTLLLALFLRVLFPLALPHSVVRVRARPPPMSLHPAFPLLSLRLEALTIF